MYVDISAARPLVHLAYSVDDGFQVVDVWSNEDMCRKMVDNPRFRELLGERVRTCPDRHPGGAPARVAGFRNTDVPLNGSRCEATGFRPVIRSDSTATLAVTCEP